MRTLTFKTWLLLLSSLLFCGSTIAQADLSLSIAQSSQTPARYSLYSVTVTVANAGPQGATGVAVQIPIPAGVVYEGGSEYSASQGQLTRFGSNAGRWTVGSIASGGSATITVNYFLNAAIAPASYAEVSASTQTDPDSTPGNGNGLVTEDDEASTAGGPAGQADLQPRNLRVQNPSIASGTNLEYLFNIRNAGTADVPGDFKVRSYLSTDNQLSANDIQDGTITTGNFDAGAQVDNILGASSTSSLSPGAYFLILVVDADSEVAESNENNNTRVQPFVITGVSGCNISASVVSIDCDSQGSPVGSDDTYSVTILVENGGASGTWTSPAVGSEPAFSGNYGVPYIIQGGNIQAAINLGGLFFNRSVVDDIDPTCGTSFSWQTPGSTCSNAGGVIDLSLTLSQNVTTPSRYSLYSVTATVTNAGPQAATGITVDIPRPAGVVYEGGNEFTVSQGGFTTYGGNQGQWQVGAIGALESATITVNYFRTGATASDSYAEVLTANQLDGDSTPGNGNGQVNEDDEASTGNIQPPICSITGSLSSIDCDDNGTPNNPNDDRYSFSISAVATNASQNFSVTYNNIDYTVTYGGILTLGSYIIGTTAGSTFQVEVHDLLDPSCNDFIGITVPGTCSGGTTTGACTFEQPATINPLDQQFYTDINVEQTANGYEMTAIADLNFNSINQRTAIYSYDANGVQVSSTPAVTSAAFTESVTVDFQMAELIVNDFNGGTIRVPFTDPAPAGSPGDYEGGFTARLPDGSGYLVFVRQVELNGPAADVTTLRSFRIDASYQQVGSVSTYPAMPTRYEAATFTAPSGQGNYFLRIIERGTNNTFTLVDSDYARLGGMSLGYSGRFYQPMEYQELSDGTFVIASFFDGADPNRANRIERYTRTGTVVSTYFSSSSFTVGRDVRQAIIRQDGGFVGVSGRNASGSTIEVRNGDGALLATNYLDGLFAIDLTGVTADTSITLLASRDSVNGQRVFVKLTRLGEQECNPVYDPCDPPSTEPTSAIVSHSTAPGGIVTINHNLYGSPGSITIDGPTRLGIQLITPAEFYVGSVVNHGGRIFVTGRLRDNINPGNAQPFVLETDAQARDLSSFIPVLQSADLNSFGVVASEDFATIIVEYLTYGRSYGIAKIRSGQVLADEIQVGDLVTNRISGSVVNKTDDVIYLSYRDGNSGSWPRLRVLSLADLSLIAEVRLADAVITSAGLVSGNTGYLNVLPSGDVAVPFSANDGNVTQQFAAIIDPMGNIVSTTTLPNGPTPSNQFSSYSASGVTPNGDVRLTRGGSAGEPLTQVAWLANGTVITCSSGPAQGVDLELTATSGSNQPAIYDANSITVSLTNTGTQTATGVTVNVPMPASVVYSGGNEFTASQGTFETYGADQGAWTVGSLAAGETATVVVNYFSLSATGYTQFVEVLSQNEPDADSSPGNGSGTSANEDDEAFLDLTFAARNALTLSFYPNPAPTGEQIVLKYESSGETDTPLLISDLNGRVVYRSRVQFNEGYNEVPVSMGTLPSGVYVLSLTDTGLMPTRLVVR